MPRGNPGVPRAHGRCGTPEYTIWKLIRQRLKNPKSVRWSSYGGAGVRMCRRWWTDFAAFYADLGPRPSPDHSVDRSDAAGHYSCGRCDECRASGWPANCRWATRAEQARNKRATVRVTIGGVTRPLAEWVEMRGATAATVYRRIRVLGWASERALAEPVVRRASPQSVRTLHYGVWYQAVRRCHDPRHRQYADYGGRGIVVCERWRGSFDAFLDDMGYRPTAAHSLDRIDNDGPYSPGNCRWATATEQNHNRRLPGSRPV